MYHWDCGVTVTHHESLKGRTFYWQPVGTGLTNVGDEFLDRPVHFRMCEQRNMRVRVELIQIDGYGRG